MIYWIIVLDYALYERYTIRGIFAIQHHIMLSEYDVDHTPAAMAAFLFGSKERFEKIFGDNCLILPAKDESSVTRTACLEKAESLGWIQDSTSSGFVTWW